jgi:hypothetical protein
VYKVLEYIKRYRHTHRFTRELQGQYRRTPGGYRVGRAAQIGPHAITTDTVNTYEGERLKAAAGIYVYRTQAQAVKFCVDFPNHVVVRCKVSPDDLLQVANDCERATYRKIIPAKIVYRSRAT